MALLFLVFSDAPISVFFQQVALELSGNGGKLHSTARGVAISQKPLLNAEIPSLLRNLLGVDLMFKKIMIALIFTSGVTFAAAPDYHQKELGHKNPKIEHKFHKHGDRGDMRKEHIARKMMMHKRKHMMMERHMRQGGMQKGKRRMKKGMPENYKNRWKNMPNNPKESLEKRLEMMAQRIDNAMTKTKNPQAKDYLNDAKMLVKKGEVKAAMGLIRAAYALEK